MTNTAGSQTHCTSLRKTRTPVTERNACRLMGETRMGRQGKKYRRLSKGAKKATPKPPFVSASSIPCESVERHKKPNACRRHACDGCAAIGSSHVRDALRKTAKDHEKAVAQFAAEAKEGDNPELKAYAAQQLPTLQDHLQQARDLAAKYQ